MKTIARIFIALWIFENGAPLAWTPGESSRTVGENETLAEARRNALNEARRDAVARANGTEVTGKTIVESSQLVLDLVAAYQEGMIVNEETLESRPEIVSAGGKYFI